MLVKNVSSVKQEYNTSLASIWGGTPCVSIAAKGTI